VTVVEDVVEQIVMGRRCTCQTFQELMELAARGTERSVSQYSSDINYTSNAVDDDDSAYVAMGNRLQDMPILLCSFGKAADAEPGRSPLPRARSKFIVEFGTDVCCTYRNEHDRS